MVEKYYSPEGFVKDKNCGLYYHTVMGIDERGATVQNVTWFNAETGEYSYYQYPFESVQENPDRPTQEVNSGRGFPKTLLIRIGGIAATALLCFGIWKGACKVITQENKSTSESGNASNESSRWDGVYQGEGFTIVFASEGRETEYCTSDYHIVVDSGYDVFFPRTAAMVSENLIEDYTEREHEIVAELSFKLEGDILYYHRLICKDGYVDDIKLTKTDGNPLNYYQKYWSTNQETYK